LTTRILLVDDDQKIISLLKRGLTYEHFEVYTAPDGESGLVAAKIYQPHLVLLDIGMPALDGFEVCQRLRLLGDVPIIMLTARDDVADKVNALGLGADDYVPKPFSFEELVARMRAVLRRHKSSEEPLVYDDVQLNQVTREVSRGEQQIELTMREYDLLLFFLRHPRQVLTRDQILAQVWGYDTDLETNVLEVHVGHIRQKLEASGGKRIIQTIRGVGYVLRG
jgi:two-component system, OmpR family, response regulator MprA